MLTFIKLDGISTWDAKSGDKLMGKIVVENHCTSSGLEEGEHKVWVSDHTLPEPVLIAKQPLENINHAKAVLEYHFRDYAT